MDAQTAAHHPACRTDPTMISVRGLPTAPAGQAGAGRRARRQLLISGACLLLAIVGLLWPSWRQLRVIEARSRAVDAEIAHLEQTIAQLTAEREKLTTDPTYVERVARQEFHATRPGEILLKVQPPAESTHPPADSQDH